MTRRLLWAGALIVGLAGVSVVWAQAQATFVLNNGERHSGSMTYPRDNNNIVDSRFHLMESGSDHTYGLNDVVVIDFAGGSPSTAERDAVPSDSNGLMVMRNGTFQRGHLHNIVGGGEGGEMVQWVNESGQRNNYPIGDVSRLYLNGGAARTAFLNTSGQTAAAAPAAATPGPIQVEANRAWVDTGMSVKKGDRLRFNGNGTITYGPGLTTGVEGVRSGFGLPGGPVVKAVGVGGLIGSVNGTPFAIGSNRGYITMPADGQLMLGVNDNKFDDNSGAFTVTISR